MRTLLGPESHFANFFNKLFDILVLNFLVVVCSLPVITMGASLTALYHSVNRMQKGEGGLEMIALLVWFALAAYVNLRIIEKPLAQIEENADLA